MNHVALGLKRDVALQISGMTKHQYYYEPKTNKGGRQKSTHTLQYTSNGKEQMSNELVVEAIQLVASDPDTHYGYQKMTKELQMQGYHINAKKVYRLMKQNQLLHKKVKQNNKKYVKYRKVCPSGPYELMEMDIKFVWVASQRRHGYILSVIDVFSRKVLEWRAGMSITQHTVKDVWEEIIIHHLQENDMLNKGIHIEVRTDNDKRFSATMVQEFFKENYLNQVFTHPYTPQENGHIESFHAILGRSLDRYVFETIDDLQMHLHLFYDKYNNERIHSSIAKLPPNTFLEQWRKGNIMRCIDTEKKKAKFKLMIPYRNIRTSGNGNWREASCLPEGHLKEVSSATTLQQPSVQRSPSVASC